MPSGADTHGAYTGENDRRLDRAIRLRQRSREIGRGRGVAVPMDLVAVLGEGWCVTLIRGREPDEALTILGAAPGSIR